MAGSSENETPPLPPGGSTAERIGELLGTTVTRVERTLRDPARRRTLILSAAGVLVLLALLVVVPNVARRARPTAPPPAAQPGAEQPAPGAEQPAPAQPAPAQPAPAQGQPAPADPSAVPPAQRQPQMLISALPLLLGLFWLLSAWLVDAEARRAFVVQEPWGDRRTLAYTVLAVGCVFPLILAGLIFSAWGFVTFVLDVSRRQSPIAALQAAALILIAGAGFLVLRGLLARWMDQRKASRS